MNPDANESLDRALECAIVVSWPDLTHGAQTGLIHVEYGFAPNGTLECLRVWSSIARGHWLLACDYGTTGVRFDNAYQSEGLAHNLGFVMQHQDLFVLPQNLGRKGLLQISMPTVQESVAAAALINTALDRLTSTFAEPAIA
jgi:hypothetical protein